MNTHKSVQVHVTVFRNLFTIHVHRMSLRGWTVRFLPFWILWIGFYLNLLNGLCRDRGFSFDFSLNNFVNHFILFYTFIILYSNNSESRIYIFTHLFTLKKKTNKQIKLITVFKYLHYIRIDILICIKVFAIRNTIIDPVASSSFWF